MKIFIMTDLEGCAGIMNAQDWIYGTSKYYEKACELASLEVSAAVEGALEGGATEVVVVDGHGPGAMRRELLHPRARLLGGRPWPKEIVTYGFDGTFTAAMIVGQHAMSGTDGGHLSHTMSFGVEEYLLNDTPIGELGLIALIAGYFNAPLIMVSGDQAACEEARVIVPNIETAAVKYGVRRGSSAGMSRDENEVFNSLAMHLHPDEARARVREHAFRAVRRIPEIAPYRVEGPYALTVRNRATPESAPTSAVLKAADFLDLLREGRGIGKAKPPAKPAARASALARKAKSPAAKPAKSGKKGK
jgi:D-amino peptidase